MKNKKVFLSAILLLGSSVSFAQTDSVSVDTVSVDSISKNAVKKLSFDQQPKTFWWKVRNAIREFTRIDKDYIEEQHYNYALMLQNTNTYEVYRLNSREGHSITFSPDPTYRLGPYFGWRWIFLGYTLDVTHLGGGGKSKKDFNISLYANQVGVDLFWRETGNDYKIRNLEFGTALDTSPLNGKSFDGFSATIKGFNLYYIANHRKFSYPAAYSQSTVQRKSAGSFLLGLGYTQHTLNVDWNKLNNLVETTLDVAGKAHPVDSTLMFGRIKYTDISFTGGYSYNWVFAHNWLFNFSGSVGLAYNHSTNDEEHSRFTLRDFDFKNFNIDGTVRAGIVWNNTKWYAGASTILHTYNYQQSQFYTNNTFGNLNFYVGFNFMRKKK